MSAFAPKDYQTRVLESSLRVDTTTHSAKVMQDELGNSYSLVC